MGRETERKSRLDRGRRVEGGLGVQLRLHWEPGPT